MGCCASIPEINLLTLQKDLFFFPEAWQDFPIGTVVSAAAGGKNRLLTLVGDPVDVELTTTLTETDEQGVILERVVTQNGRKSETLVELPKNPPRRLGKEVVEVATKSYECSVFQSTNDEVKRTFWETDGHPLPLQMKFEMNLPIPRNAQSEQIVAIPGTRRTKQTVVLHASSLTPLSEPICGRTVPIYRYATAFLDDKGGRVLVSVKLDADDEKRQKILTVVVKQAEELISADVGGHSDPYCVLTLGRQSHKTSVKEDTCTPEWDEIFQFVVPPGTQGTEIRFQMYDKDVVGSDSMGNGVLHLTYEIMAACLGTAIDHWVNLSMSSGGGDADEFAGTYYLSPSVPGWGACLLPPSFPLKDVYTYSTDPTWVESMRADFESRPFLFVSAIKRVSNSLVKAYKDKRIVDKGPDEED